MSNSQRHQQDGPRHSLSVAVIGGGAAGLVVARELAREGHQPVVYERSTRIGGVWAYSEETEADPLSREPARRRVHGSMYARLRTNLPREVMGFLDFPFDAHFPGSRDPRQFCGHEEVQRYLEAFAAHWDLLRFVRFGSEVAKIEPLGRPPPPAGAAAATATAEPAVDAGSGGGSAGAQENGSSGSGNARWLRWRVAVRRAGGDAGSNAAAGAEQAEQTLEHDAVVVCNGHYSEPQLPDFPGQDSFPGVVMHSHNYRRPEPFAGQVVVLVGAASSGVDISQETAEVAEKVYLCARAWHNPLTCEPINYSQAPKGSKVASVAADAVVRSANLRVLRADGSVELEDGTVIPHVDTVMYCTGYAYSFPFLDVAAVPEVAVEEGVVGPLYQHVFPPALAPTLAFVGLPFNIIPFPQFELQAKWIARVLSGAAELPPAAQMYHETEAFYEQLALGGIARQYTHRQLGPLQFRYNRWLAAQLGPAAPRLPAWREALYGATGASRTANFDLYRDVPLSQATPEAAEAEAEAREEAAALRAGWAAAAVA